MLRCGHHHIGVTIRGQVVWLLDNIRRDLRSLLAGVHRERIMWQIGVIEHTMRVGPVVVGPTALHGAERVKRVMTVMAVVTMGRVMVVILIGHPRVQVPHWCSGWLAQLGQSVAMNYFLLMCLCNFGCFLQSLCFC